MIFRRASPSDYSGICDLAAANHRDGLSVDAQRQGFLSARFSLGQIGAMAEDLGVMVAVAEERVVGFMCASRCEWTGQPAIVRHMVDCFPQCRWHNRPLDGNGAFVYGPVCIDMAYRGQGVLRKMYQCLLRELQGRYRVGVGFVADENEASLRAHTEGLKMHQVGSFTFAGRSYRMLAFDIQPEP